MLTFVRASSIALAVSAISISLPAQAPTPRPLRVSDLYRLRDVRDPRISPDGKWVAYTVTSVDSARDKNVTHIWMTSWDGAHTIQMTSSAESEHEPRWSPDGRYLAFLSSRAGAKKGQVWLLDRMGGEAEKLTSMPGGVSDYAWSPDGKRLVLVTTDADSTEADSARPKPIVIDRYRFKDDNEGYLGPQHDHLYLFDVDTKRAELLTTGNFDDEDPAWSPDGKWIAFVSNHSAPDPDRTENTDVFVIEPRAGASPKQLTTWPGPDDGPLAWSPDSRMIAYRQGGEPKYTAYNMNRLAVVPVDGGAPRVVTATLDRGVFDPVWSADGASLLFLVADDRTQYLARVSATGGPVQHVIEGPRVIISLTNDSHGDLAALVSTPTLPPEVFAIDGDTLRRLSHQNDAWLRDVRLATTEGITAREKDGTTVDGLLVKPASYVAGRKYPTLLRIHGGPNGQDAYDFSFERELFAANGYVVITANYRGSSGRGEAYGTSIFADWGDKEVKDLLAMTDRAVALGVADSSRLGIGGWSYGAILTDYTIANTHRFKAAIAGAGSALQTTMYGVDEYIVQYEEELGSPWTHEAVWLKVSYPFFHADRITTPTLFLGGDKDFNVPLVGGEQMYQALRVLGIDTELIIYPGEHHGIMRPSFRRDRLERYLAWYDKYLQPRATATRAASSGTAP